MPFNRQRNATPANRFRYDSKPIYNSAYYYAAVAYSVESELQTVVNSDDTILTHYIAFKVSIFYLVGIYPILIPTILIR